jgi:hypothetical protein
MQRTLVKPHSNYAVLISNTSIIDSKPKGKSKLENYMYNGKFFTLENQNDGCYVIGLIPVYEQKRMPALNGSILFSAKKCQKMHSY